LGLKMTVNRLTDEQLKRIVNCKGDFYGENKCKGEDVSIAQELLTLRKENERLRKKVEVGDTIANHLEIILEDFDGEPHDAYTYKQDIKKWRESGVKGDSE
jgi:uncharacterized protein (UPF0335 family)